MKLPIHIDPDLIARYDSARVVWLAMPDEPADGDWTTHRRRIGEAVDAMDDAARRIALLVSGEYADALVERAKRAGLKDEAIAKSGELAAALMRAANE